MDFESKVKNVHGDKIKCLNPESYMSRHSVLDFKCRECNHVWKNRPTNVVANRKAGCPECTKKEYMRKNKITYLDKRGPDWLQDELNNKFGYIYVYPNTYESASRKAKFLCKNCNNVWEQYPKAILKMIHGCPKCAARISGKLFHKIKKSRIRKIAKENNISVLSNISNRVNYKCNKCGYIGSTRNSAFLKSTIKCMMCSLEEKASNKRRKKILRCSGKKFKVEGYENYALNILVQEGYNPKDIKHKYKNKPLIALPENKYHIPDFFIPKENLIIEVKSLYTAGLHSDIRYFSFRSLRKKYKAARRKGYKYRLMLISNKGYLYTIPNNWYNLHKSCMKNSIYLPG